MFAEKLYLSKGHSREAQQVLRTLKSEASPSEHLEQKAYFPHNSEQIQKGTLFCARYS